MKSTNLFMLVSAITLLISTFSDVSLEKPIDDNAMEEMLKPNFSMCRTGGIFVLEPLIDYNEPIAPKLDGLGDLHFEVTTNSSQAQAFFDQGMRLVYAFNHAEAYRAFQEASRLDPNMCMAYWGQALSLGPNINDPLPDLMRHKIAYEAITKAKERSTSASAMEKALIEAYQARCTNEEVEQQALNDRYHEEMKMVYRDFGDHPEVGTLYAASIMNTMPWNYWDENKEPRPGTTEAVDAITKVVNSYPSHPGARHYHIHIIEAVDPHSALATADALGPLMPAAGHLVHMPSHIYIGTGMYEKAAEVNRKAIKADEAYIAQCQAQGMYPLVYYPHNIHFLWAATSITGNSEEAIDAAEKVALRIPREQAGILPFLQDFMAVPVQTYVRFGRWNDILSTPGPDTSLLHTRMMWHYARGFALARLGLLDAADAELESVKAIAADPRAKTLLAAYNNPTSEVGKVASMSLAGEIAAERGDLDQAIGLLKSADIHEKNLVYQEPAAWHYPVKQALGAVMLQAGQAAEAEAVYRADLDRLPGNGWSLFGLYQSLVDQGKVEEAKETKVQFEKAWEHADVALTASRF
ncbi:MAG: hypothetical protein KTR24_12855 [Saprospiraceae bacterium]|nr:hypothetical protein [Saprospiraceae bacterium]